MFYTMGKFALLVFACLFLQSSLRAQEVPEWNAAKIKLQLEKLGTLGSVLYVAAHPDDENTRLLAYLSNGKKYRTGYLSLTRGDGGQNLVGDEQGAYLGLMRTEELLAARHIDGAEQFFSHANDFGFSKTAVETFEFWGHQRILADVVWIVRKFRPDVIICRFPEDKRAGHGNHWASAILAHEAFKAAADPAKFPEQLKYVKPWQAKRILWNTYHFGGMNTTAADQLNIGVGGYNPLLGKGYGEIAAESRSMHKTQGFGVSPSYGQSTEYFKTIAGTPPHQTLMDGINTTWTRVRGGVRVDSLVRQVLRGYDMDHPEKSVPLLLKIRSAIAGIGDSYWRKQKEKAVDRLITACSGIWMDAYTSTAYGVAGQPLEVNTEVINRSNVPVSFDQVDIAGKKHTPGKKLSENELEKDTYKIMVPAGTPLSQPYWLIEKHPVGYYNIGDQRLVGRPENSPSLTARFHLVIAGQPLTVNVPVVNTYTDPVRGEVQDPLAIAPPVTANVASEVYVFTAETSQQVDVKLAGYEAGVKGVAHLVAPDGFSVRNNDQSFSLPHAGDEQLLHFTVARSSAIEASSSGPLLVQLQVGGKTYDRGIKVIAPGYIPTITVFPLSETKLVSVPLKISGSSIGYIMGAGDKVPQALTQIGYHVKLLSDQELTGARLEQFDAIVVGIRAFNTRKILGHVRGRLMDYVKEGGTLVVQYNKNFGLVADDPGPYPFSITKNRVTDETAKVSFLLPDDPSLNIPNKITEKDFEGWIQERGVYFVDGMDPHYRQPLAMHDPGEAPLDGSLIICDYGKGKYVYTGLDFFRELPAGVPGAFRLFANLIAKK
jgi:LmbE family N-acetylglucosaminyl deacetylase